MKIINKPIAAGIAIILAVCVNVFAVTATITAMKGDVKFVKKGYTEWQAATVGILLEEGDKVGSKENSWVQISFSAGHQAKLGANSFIVINRIKRKYVSEAF